jgi:hypothetical protein
VLELLVPADVEFEPELELGRIGRGYRHVLQRGGDPGTSKRQGDCNVDVACGTDDGLPWVDGWRDEIRSVAVYTIDGFLKCTGTLIADAPRSFEPYFLTAYHCGVSSHNAHTVVTYWNFQSARCGDHGGGDRSQSVSGATLLARRADVDFCLLRLDAAPPQRYAPYWSGWDRRRTITPVGAISIHHPDAGEKSISLNDDALAVTSSCIMTGGPPDSHWEVDSWEYGTTEHGSSGAGLWDPSSHLLVGFLSGGLAACGNELWDCFGRLAAAWDGPSAGERLRDWLDPEGTGTERVSGGSGFGKLRVPHQRGQRPPPKPRFQRTH